MDSQHTSAALSSNVLSDEDRPRKRSRFSAEHDNYSTPSHKQIVLEELDLEIALRQRLSHTIQSRLTWALLLQETLEKDFRVHGGEELDFQIAALDALRAAEAPCEVLFDRGVFARKPKAPPLQQPLSSPALAPENTTLPQSTSRSSSTRVRGLPRAPPPPARKLLFLRDSNTDPPTIAKLACPDCKRSDFSNLQGLLNHCRIRHHREYGSHDECVQSCAVLVPQEERDWVVANGTELGGISLPSLRRLFEIAVGASERVAFLGLQKGLDAEKHAVDSEDISEQIFDSQPPATHVTRTLGYHKDTPALAPFLGRALKRRVINVYGDEDEVVDIVGNSSGSDAGFQRGRHKWRMPYNHRNIDRPELDGVVHPTLVSENVDDPPHRGSANANPQPMTPAPQGVITSRFHIVARVKVADHSLWLSPERRPKHREGETHRWRLSVSSPSYSIHITSFLEKLTVTCLTDPPPSTLIEPIVVIEPPFVATSTTDRPFLARLTFTWVGSKNAPMEIEHWVELDPIHVAHPVIGDEQVFDVELDRNTELLPVREDRRKITWDDGQLADKVHTNVAGQKHGVVTDPDYVVKLKALLSQVPMTLKDMKGRIPTKLPYTLVSSPAHFRKLVPGRRKAIEMGRARALRDAYQREITSLPLSTDSTALTTADVYRWMEDENLFPHAVANKQRHEVEDGGTQQGSAAAAPPTTDIYCRYCGLHQLLHPLGVKSELTGSADPSTVQATSTIAVGPGLDACVAFNVESVRIPLLDVNRLLNQPQSASLMPDLPYSLSPAIFAIPTPSQALPRACVPSPADLVTMADPKLLLAIRAQVARWNLACFDPVDQKRTDDNAVSLSHSLLALSRQEIVNRYAPHALLALLTTSMIKLLIHRGIDAFRRDEAALRMLGRAERSRRRQGATPTPAHRRLLTRSHVLRGLIDGAPGGLTNSAALLCVARLGQASQRSTMVIESDHACRIDARF
ncbi:hypothetical protein AcV5_007694 [Taiwanofungus camphoratus]|nr:hypothetical protein AcV5_007694 [Antrodia cinnamomea]